MPSVVQHPRARIEILEAAEYYERQRLGLGTQFLNEVEIAIAAVGANPNTGFIYDHGMRTVRRFPYGVIFAKRQDMVVVYAVAHHRRKPGYWMSRLKDEPE